MNLIIETDLGSDPDDFFAICYLAACGVNIQAITISPGNRYQIAVAKLICKQLGLDIPIGYSKFNSKPHAYNHFHYDLLEKYGSSFSETPDGEGHKIVSALITDDTELFVIGPVTSIAKYLETSNKPIQRATMQGGFLPYSLYSPQIKDEKFIGKEWMPTFNLNGDRPAGMKFLSADIKRRQMVGKNVCHTVLFEKWQYDLIKPNNRAGELFKEAAAIYFERHDSKKFHDPTAACLHLHPEIGTWFCGKTVKRESGWTTECGGDYVCGDVDRERLWDCLFNFR